MCFEPFTPSRKYAGVEFAERSKIRFRKSVDFRTNNKLLLPGL